MQHVTLFEDIFSDALLVDIDLATWDKQIALYVLADHVGRTPDNRKPLFVVAFVRVRHWNLVFPHLDFDPPIDYGSHQHIQWKIDESRVETVAEGLQISLWRQSASPHLTIICEDVDIRELPLNIPDKLFPGWTKPYTGLIRPGLADWPPDHIAKR